jgi:NAD(P)-dependent dehydrogenase (short-subunit alcohol dehydrogenase family)
VVVDAIGEEMGSGGDKREWGVVVGATGAIGTRIVERLAESGLGVLAVARTQEELEALAGTGSNVVACAADITDPGAEATIRSAVPGRVRMAVNAAAAPMGGGVLEVSPEAVLGAVDVKVNGTLRLVHAVESFLVQDSRIVVLGGNLGYDPIPEAATAGVANAALANLIRQLSRALGPRGVTCHIVAPGPVWTERLKALLSDAARVRGVDESVVVDEFRAKSPIGHLVTIDEVVWAVTMLLAPEARGLAGGALIVDVGQRTAMP